MTKHLAALSRIVALALLLTFVLVLPAQAASHTIYGNGKYGIYIDIDSGYYASYSNVATWGKYAYTTSGCAWFASARVRELTGKGSTILAGSAWYSRASEFGFTKGTTLLQGTRALACWSGHVAVIEGFTSDGKIIVSEGGVSHLSYVTSANGYCHITTFSSEANLKKESSSSFLGYVYLSAVDPVSIEVDYHDFESSAAEMYVGYTDATIGHTIHISGAPISAITQVGITLYDADTMAVVGSKTEIPKPVNGVINVWYKIKEELTGGADLLQGHNYLGVFQATLGSSYGGKTYTYNHPFTTQGVKVTSIGLSSYSLSLRNGTSQTLYATVNPSNASNKTVKWSSSNIYVAAVDNSGTVTAIAPGSATITCAATDGSGVYATCAVNVYKLVSSITLNQTSLSLSLGGSATLWATVQDSDASNRAVNWTSSNSAVATVSGGSVNAVGVGSATITATAADGSGVSASCTVTVSPIKVDQITVMPATLTLAVGGDSAKLQATVSPSTATNTGVVWQSQDISIATVSSDGTVTPVKAGVTEIRAIASDGGGASGKCTVTVESGIDSLEFRRYAVKLATSGIGTSYQLEPVVTPDHIPYTIRYASDDPSVVSVSSAGLLTAVGAGSTTITATIPYGPETSVYVTVSDMGLMALPRDLVEISAEAFAGGQMERFTISSDVERIGERAFAGNKKLNWILIPNSVVDIADDAFSGSTNVCILCGPGSYAERWAAAHNVDYSLDDAAAFVPVKRVKVPGNLSIDVDNVIWLTATVSPATASNQSVSWTSSNPAVASVTTDGKLTALTAGQTTVTATACDGSGASASFVLTVTLPNITANFEPDPDNTVIGIDDADLSAVLTVTGVDLDKVQSTGVFLLNASGKALAVAECEPFVSGSAIRCAFNVNEDLSYTLTPSTAYKYRFYATIYGEQYESADYSFTTGAAVPSLTLPVSELTMALGGTYTLTPVVKFAEDDTVLWATSKSTVVKVKNGELTAMGVGTATVTAMLAEATSLRATCTVTVAEENTDIYVTSITMDPAEMTLTPGETRQVTATALPTYAADRTVNYTTSDANVATVSASGLVTAVGAGEALIIGVSNDTGEVRAACEVQLNGVVTVNYVEYPAKQYIGTTNAVLARTFQVSGASINDVTYVGIELYNAQGNLLAQKREVPLPVNGVINVWYDVNAELGVTLTAGATYKCRFVAVVNGKDYFSGYYSFTTAKPAEIVNVSFSANDHQSIGSMTPIVARTISVSGAAAISDVTTVGCYLYDANGALLALKTETPKPLNGVINAWYDVQNELSYTLSAGTTYQYKLLAVVKGQEYYSAMDSFTTPNSPTDVSVTFSSNARQSIGSSNATLARTISVVGTGIESVTTVGCYLYDANGNQLASKRETPTPLDGVINAWYDVKSELGVSLVAGTTYKYRFVAVVDNNDCYSDYDSFTPRIVTANTAKIQAVLDRAYQWVNYTWTAPVDIPVYNNLYNNSSYSAYYQKKYYFKAGTVMHGLPYTLSSSKYNLETYAALSNAAKAEEATFTYSGVRMWGPHYGADCSGLVNDVLYYGDPAIGHDGQTWFASSKAYLYETVSWADVAPGDALAITGHTMIVVAVNGDRITTIEQCGNGSSSGALHCTNVTVRPAGGYYVCGQCAACAGAKKGATVLRTRSKSELSQYTVYRYLKLYQ